MVHIWRVAHKRIDIDVTHPHFTEALVVVSGIKKLFSIVPLRYKESRLYWCFPLKFTVFN